MIIWDIDAEIATASTHLDFRSDPADELIAATSFVRGVPLVTRDAKIRASTIVPLAIR
jgi:PIN domain nuclease of toxin-antitoxin system